MSHDPNANAVRTNPNIHAGKHPDSTKKGILYQIGIGLLAIVVIFVVIGFVVRTTLTIFI